MCYDVLLPDPYRVFYFRHGGTYSELSGESEHFRKVRHRFGYLDLLRTYRLAAAASDAGIGAAVGVERVNRHRCYKSSARKGVLVVKLEKTRNIEMLGTAGCAVAAGGAGKYALSHHLIRHFRDKLHLAFTQRFVLAEYPYVVLELIEIRHSREGDGNSGD